MHLDGVALLCFRGHQTIPSRSSRMATPTRLIRTKVSSASALSNIDVIENRHIPVGPKYTSAPARWPGKQSGKDSGICRDNLNH
ncbi:hypothetical protein GCM10010207_82700 [Streptomyces atratus]|nr:hypothetical protein GCM10010207_82700 [Streptomyces atratus]